MAGFTGEDIVATHKLKKIPKRDLTGDVQFKNAGNVGQATAFRSAPGSDTDTNNIVSTEGFNFFQPARIQLYMFGIAADTGYSPYFVAAGTAKFKVNGVVKNNVGGGISCSSTGTETCTDSTSKLGAVPAEATLLATANNTLKNSAQLELFTAQGNHISIIARANENALMKINEKITVAL